MRSKRFDEYILKSITNQIQWDIRVSNYDLSVRVHSGVVTLYGYFDHAYRHDAAVSIIQSIAGVHVLRDSSRVLADYYRPDSDTQHILKQQIEHLQLVKGEWVNVQVCDGVVKLDGEVYRPRIKAFVDRMVWELSGVKDCMNFIELIPPAPGLFEEITPAEEKLSSTRYAGTLMQSS